MKRRLLARWLGLSLIILLLSACASPEPSQGAPGPTTRPLIAYLAPASDTPHNLMVIEPVVGAEPQQITHSEPGIVTFAPAPDGTHIAFSENNATGGTDLKLLDLTSGTITTLAACPEATCDSPAWHPDGTRLAYERTPLTAPPEAPVRPTRVHVITLSASPAADEALFADDATIYSAGPVWSPDGTRLASYDAQNGGILLREMTGGETGFIPALHGTVGAFAPEGDRLVFPEIDFVSESAFYTHLRLADLTDDTITALDPPESPASDERAIWTRDGALLIVSRRYMDERYTPGPQLYLLDPATGDTKPLVVDAAYYHGSANLDPAGEWLAFQRLQPPAEVTAAPTPPEIWLYNMADGKLARLVTDAFLPQWIP